MHYVCSEDNFRQCQREFTSDEILHDHRLAVIITRLHFCNTIERFFMNIRYWYSLIITGLMISCVPYGAYPPLKVDTSNWPRTDWNERQFREYYDRTPSLDPIEGIWSMSEEVVWTNVSTGLTGSEEKASKYRFAVLRDTSLIDKYNSYLLESRQEDWLPGMLKAKYRKTAYSGAYEEIWYMGDFTEQVNNVVIENSGIITKNDKKADYPFNLEINTLMLKVYPPINDARQPSTASTVKSTGSGFLATSTGLVVTNFHVIEGATKIEISIPYLGEMFSATLRIKDVINDLAILEMTNFAYSDHYSDSIPYTIAKSASSKMGEEVFTLGFPLGSIMGTQSRLSTGRINSLYGIDEDPRLLQVGTPIQPGNSGGPLFNMDGEIVGIVVSGLNARYFYENMGIVPQNVNFAIKVDYLSNLLSMLPGDNQKEGVAAVNQPKSIEQMVEQYNPFIVQVHSSK